MNQALWLLRSRLETSRATTGDAIDFSPSLINGEMLNSNICYGGKGSGGGTNTVTNNSAPPPEVTAAYQQALSQAQSAASRPLEQYQGQTVAPFNEAENSAFGTINGAQGLAQPYINNAAGLIQQSTQPLWNNVQQFSPSAINQYISPYTGQVLNAAVAQQQNTDAQQQQALKGNAISANAWGGDRAGVASAILSGQQDIANNATNANILNTGYNQALGEFNNQQGAQLGANATNASLAQQGAFGMANLGNQALGTTLTAANAQLASGQLQQQQTQAGLNVPYEQFLQQQAYPFQTAQYYANIAEGIGGNSGGQSSTTSPGPSTLSQAGGNALGLGSLAYLGYLALSDRRQKEDIHRVGTFKGQYPLYTYRYKKGGMGTQVGVMAQDVEKKNPDAVHERNGVKYVDYSKLARGGVASGYGAGGGVPDLSVSYVPTAPPLASHGGGPPRPPAAYDAGDPMATGENQLLSTLKLSALGGDKKGLTSPSDSSIGDLGQIFGSSAGINADTGNAFTTQNSLDSSFLSPGNVGSLGLNWRRGGRAYKVGGDVLPILGDIAGAFFGDPLAGHQAQGFADMLHLQRGGVPHYAPGGYIPMPPSKDDLDRQLELRNEIGEDNSVEPTLISSEFTPGALGTNRQMVASAEPPPGVEVPPSDAAPSEPPAPELPAPVSAPGAMGTAPAAAPKEETEHATPTREAVNPWLALAAAGFGMAAGNSPYIGQNIGAGGLEGIKNYAGQQKQADTVNEAADRLVQEAKQHKEQIAIEQQNADTNAQYRKDQTAYQQAALKQKELIKDAFGNPMGWADPVTGVVKPIQGGPGSVSGTGTPDGARGEAKTPKIDLSGLPPDAQERLLQYPEQAQPTILGLIQGRIPPDRMHLGTNPQAYISAATVVDPTFDAAKPVERMKTAADYSPAGKSGQLITSLNTASRHAAATALAGLELNNTSGFPFATTVNDMLNKTEARAGDSRMGNYNSFLGNYGHEAMKVISGKTNPGEAETAQFMAPMDPSGSPEEILGALSAKNGLMLSRAEEMQRAYDTSMGPYGQPRKVVSPEAEQAFRDMDTLYLAAKTDKLNTPEAKDAKKRLEVYAKPTAETKSKSEALPPPEKREKGKVYTNANGHKAKWTGTGWVSQ